MSIHHDLVAWANKNRLTFDGKIKSCLDFSVKSGESSELTGRLKEVDDAIKTLSYRHKQAITYHYIRRYSKNKAAWELGIALSMYNSIFDSAIEKLEILL